MGERQIGEINDLLLGDKAKGCEHGNPAVSNLRLSPALDIGLLPGITQEIGGVEDVYNARA